MSSNDYDKDYISTIFANEANFDADLHSVFDTHFLSMDTSVVGAGNEVFSLSRKLARFLLHNCKHTVPDEKQVKKILRLKANYEYHGAKASWSGSPISINNKTRTIEDGVTRLYAAALMKGSGVCAPMVLKES